VVPFGEFARTPEPPVLLVRARPNAPPKGFDLIESGEEHYKVVPVLKPCRRFLTDSVHSSADESLGQRRKKKHQRPLR
jgi:hypothetical protein